MKKILLLAGFISLFASLSHSQSLLSGGGPEVFGASNATGIFTRGSHWTTSNAIPVSSTYTTPYSFSGAYYARIGTVTAIANSYLTLTNPISTVNKTNITVYFSEWLTGSFDRTKIQLEYSINNGSTWTVTSFTSTASTSTNTTLRSFTLPPAAAGVSQLKIRFSTNSTFTTTGSYRIDDFAVYGTGVLVNYYNNGIGILDDVTSWGTNTDGSGANPVDFTSELQIFNITNGSSVSIGDYWQVAGSGSYINLGNGTNPIAFTTNYGVDGTINISNNASLVVNTDAYTPTLGTLSTGSNVSYTYSLDQFIAPATYYNLTLSDAGGKWFYGGAPYIVTNTFDNTALTGFIYLDADKLTLQGSITGTAPFVGTMFSEIVINKSGGGSIGTLYFDPSSILFKLTIISGDVILGSDLQISGEVGSTPVLSIASGASLDVGAHIIKGTSLDESVPINGTFKTSNLNGLNGSASTSFDTAILPTLTSSTIEYNATTGSQTITPFPDVNAYYNLTLSGAATKVFTGASYTIKKDFVKSGGTANVDAASTFTFSGSNTQAIAGITYYTVIFSGTSAKTLSTTDSTHVVLTMTVEGTASVVTNGMLVLESSAANRTANLLDETASGGVTGNVTFKRYIRTTRQGIPSVSGQSIMLTSPVATTLSNFQPTNLNFYEYVPTNATGLRFTKVNVASPTVAGKGYCLRIKGGTLFYLKGLVNNGNITRNLTFGGDNMNLIGNPYPSTIKWESPGITMTNLGASNRFSVWDGDSYNLTDVATDITPGQGFFVQAASAAASVTFTNAARNTQKPLLQRLAEEEGELKVSVKRGDKDDKCLILLNPEADSKAYSLRWDGNKLMPSSEVPALYFTKGENKLSLFTLGTVEPKVTIPLQFTFPIDTVYKLTFEGVGSIASSYQVYLVDSTLKTTQDLREIEEYAFSGTVANPAKNRFSIVISQIVTSVPDNVNMSDLFTVFSEAGNAYFNMEVTPKSLTILNVAGEKVYNSTSLGNKNFSVDLSSNSKGVYIAAVETEGRILHKKFVLN